MPSSHRRREPARAALLLLLGCAACVRPAPAVPDVARSGDPLAVMRTRMAAVETLRARFTAIATVDDVQRQVSGVLISRRPDSVRLRLFALLGLPAFDVVRQGNTGFVWTPDGAGIALQAEDQFLAYIDGDHVELPRWCEDEGTGVDDTIWYDCGPAPRHVLQVAKVEKRTRALRSLTTLTTDAGQDYSDYRLVDGVPLPYRIQLSNWFTRVDITVDRWEVNPTLPPGAFTPPAGAVPLPAATRSPS